MNFYDGLKIDLIAGAIAAIVLIIMGVIAYRKRRSVKNQ